MLSHAADPSTHEASYTDGIRIGARTTSPTGGGAPTIGHYRRLPGAAAQRAARYAAAKWRWHRGLADHHARARIIRRLMSAAHSVDAGRRLDAIAADLHDLADHCSAVNARQDAELVAYLDSLEVPE